MVMTGKTIRWQDGWSSSTAAAPVVGRASLCFLQDHVLGETTRRRRVIVREGNFSCESFLLRDGHRSTRVRHPYSETKSTRSNRSFLGETSRRWGALVRGRNFSCESFLLGDGHKSTRSEAPLLVRGGNFSKHSQRNKSEVEGSRVSGSPRRKRWKVLVRIGAFSEKQVGGGRKSCGRIYPEKLFGDGKNNSSKWSSRLRTSPF
jgi:hypothetical protein